MAIKIYSFPVPLTLTFASKTAAATHNSKQNQRENNDDGEDDNDGSARLTSQRHSPMHPDTVLAVLLRTASFSHPNIIRLREIMHDPVRNKLYCVYDDCCICSLSDFPRLVHPKGSPSAARALKWYVLLANCI